MPEVGLDWSTAKVKDAKLTVELEGDVAAAWKKSFAGTVRQLGHGDWGKIEIKKRAVHVSEVGAGSEDRLRHHLESVVEQANSARRRAEAEAERSDEDAQDGVDDGPDGQMTERFRSFAESGDPPADPAA